GARRSFLGVPGDRGDPPARHDDEDEQRRDRLAAQAGPNAPGTRLHGHDAPRQLIVTCSSGNGIFVPFTPVIGGLGYGRLNERGPRMRRAGDELWNETAAVRLLNGACRAPGGGGVPTLPPPAWFSRRPGRAPHAQLPGVVTLTAS